MNNESYFSAVMVIAWILIVAATAFAPFYVRRNMAFGVSVPESEYHGGYLTKLRRIYLIVCLVSGVILAVCSLIPFARADIAAAVWVQLAAIVIYVIFTGILYLVFYFKVRAYKRASGWQIDKTAAALLTSGKDVKKPLGNQWFLIYLAVIAGTVAAALIKYPLLPEQIPMHYDIAGNVNRYAAKSAGAFLSMPIIQFLMGLLFFGINIGVLRSKRQGGSGDAEDDFNRTRAFQSVMSKTLFWIGLMVMLLFTVIELSMLMIVSVQVMIIAPVIFLIVIFGLLVYLLVKVGQGGSRMKAGKAEASKTAGDDSHWILGTFYYNKNDPSFFVERRFGMGYTLNFGNPMSWIAIVGLVVLIAAVTVLPFVLS